MNFRDIYIAHIILRTLSENIFLTFNDFQSRYIIYIILMSRHILENKYFFRYIEYRAFFLNEHKKLQLLN